jgi:hypothetical protein
MAVVICLPLFGPPGRELDEGHVLQGQHLRKLSAELSERLQHAADILDRLTTNGWTAHVAMYDALLSQPGVETQEEAACRLRALDIAPEELLIIEEVDDEDVGHA